MKIKALFSLAALIGFILGPGLASPSNLQVQAAELPGVTTTSRVVTVKAIIDPYREVVVNDRYQIVKIVSNTNQTLAPTYVLDSDQGPVLNNCLACSQEYRQIQGKLDFSKPGLVYQGSL